MKYALNIFILFVLYLNIIKGQNIGTNICNKLIYSQNEHRLPENLDDFINDKFLSKKAYINKKRDVKKIEKLISSDSLLFFNNKNFSLLIKLKRDSVLINLDSVNQFYPIDISGENDDDLKIKFYLNENKRLSGNINMADIIRGYYHFRRITKIEIEKDGIIVSIPDTLFRSFINPNLSHTYFAIKPVELYKNKKKNQYSLYFSGEFSYICENDNEYFINQDNSTYLVKLIIDLERGRFDNIDINYGILKMYGWPHCTDFWAF